MNNRIRLRRNSPLCSGRSPFSFVPHSTTNYSRESQSTVSAFSADFSAFFPPWGNRNRGITTIHFTNALRWVLETLNFRASILSEANEDRQVPKFGCLNLESMSTAFPFSLPFSFLWCASHFFSAVTRDMSSWAAHPLLHFVESRFSQTRGRRVGHGTSRCRKPLFSP